MTHKNIYDKFLIEYDKANVTSSYPSFTKVEIAAILNKAYLALISQKFTGNNVRKVGFGQDGKALVDLQPLITRKEYNDLMYQCPYTNQIMVDLVKDNQNDFLYFVSGVADFKTGTRDLVTILPQLVSRYGITAYNHPIIEIPACFIQDNKLNVLFDSRITGGYPTNIKIDYIKIPVQFTSTSMSSDTNTQFELNDQVAEELISLAVTFALENIESPRLAQKINTLQLEA